MKKLVLLFALVVCFSAKVKAQQTIDFIDFKKHIGKTATLCDTVYSVKVFNDTLTLINMGGNFPNQKFIIAIKGNKISLDWANLKKKHLCVTGVLELYKNTLQIVASEPNQIVVSK
ncbi:hypothetical protein [Mucilaginibacter sp.]|uniref:hypothetical protein n=1 Tax=Mucilaginibacter sp. TaxID=1882438 RepID=UPI002618B0B5|nr:hypothetical protein [Mucilaginibacter sp.]MDB4926358.1 hypothetical protein [Mucilaginibacter sp.]